MSSPPPDGLRAELLDDFYAECDELLTSIRQALTQLDQPEGVLASPRPVVEALARHLHTVKGNAAIVGLGPVEQLAHAMEDSLKAAMRSRTAPSRQAVDLLLKATQRLEQLVIRHRAGQPLPNNEKMLGELRVESAPDSGSAAPPTSSAVQAPAQTTADLAALLRAQGLVLSTAIFTPTAALNERGVTVNTIRARLEKMGTIASATPKIMGPGLIVFEFLVGSAQPVTELTTWANDGVKWNAGKPGAAEESGDATAGGLSLAPSHIVRVDLAKLDELMRITGDMVIHRLRLEERIARQTGETGELKEVAHALSRSLKEMRATIGRIRMVPIAEIFSRMPYVVRDLARDSGKQVSVALEGEQTEIDKFVVERLKEPLLHLVRNALVHGIESSAERVAAGKPAEATLLLKATTEGESVSIQIRDDGRGVDGEAVIKRARALQLPTAETATPEEILRILCLPGFSTRDQADRAAGRGVGMAVVATTIREMGGTLSLASEIGKGATFTLRLPLSLSIGAAIIVTVETETCAVPQGMVNEIIQVASGEARSIQKTDVIPYRGALLPLFPLRAMFRLPPRESDLLTVLVLQTERGLVGLVVDRVRGQQEIVIRPLSDSLLRVPGISGTTELGDGRPILILDPTVLTQGVIRPPEPAAP